MNRMPHSFEGDICGAPRGWRVSATLKELYGAAQQSSWKESRVVMNVSFVGTTEMKRLNRRFRGKFRPTDVLSFEQPRQRERRYRPRGVIFLGDLVFCIPVVCEQARTEQHGVRDEWRILLVHGFLHLLGMDHERSPLEAQRMARAEARLLRRMKKGGSAKSTPGLIRRNSL